MRVLLLYLLSGLSFNVLIAQDRVSGKTFATRSEVIAKNGMIATNHPIASQIGIEILKKGGSAIDAAIAANAFLGLADPGSNGIGGDLFAIVWDAKTQKLYGLNASGKSPRNLSAEQFKSELDKGKRYTYGPLSVTMPGCVDGWFALHEKFGNLPFKELLRPAIDYAIEGVPITSEVASNLKRMAKGMGEFDNPNFKETYFINGRFPEKGEIFKNPDLAQTLEIISQKGRKGFYEGEVAERIVAHLKSGGGYLSKEDLKNNKPVWENPVSINYRGYDVWEMPPNGQGIAALQILNILKGFNISGMGFGSADHIHHFVEAKKLAFEDMSKYYGDPAFGSIPLKDLLSDKYAEERRKLINPEEAGSYPFGIPSGNNTIYLTAADKDGNMVSLIQSISYYFGSLEVPKGLGFVLQNRGSGFVREKGHINEYAPEKRPFHTIIPAFVSKDGKPFLSFGLMGGDMQPQGHAQIIMNILDFGMNVQEAGDAPRIWHYGTAPHRGPVEGAGDTYLESGFDYEVIRNLMDKGHAIRMRVSVYGGYQAIMIKDGVYYGASESRKDGQAAGY
jgi:gamma-glutamyltranspeptidase / glutathione hydrolase